MDINRIFGAFGSSSKDENEFEPPTFLHNYRIEEDNHPKYYIRMFIKLVLNYTKYSNQLINLFGKADPGLDIEEISQAGEIMLYQRAFEYLAEIDIQDKYHIKILFEEANEEFELALNKGLKFFEKEEEYEKCAILKTYLDFLNFSS